MKKYKFFETKEGKTLMTATLDGTEISDSFKDVSFTVTVNADGTLSLITADTNVYDEEMLVKLLDENKTFTDPVTGDDAFLVIEEDIVDNSQREGKYTLNRKLNSFTRYKGKVRFHQDYAFLDASELTGIFNKGEVKLKVTICKGNTVDVEEVDSNKIDVDMMGRLVSEFDNFNTQPFKHDMTGGKFILKVNFFSKSDKPLYCEVDQETPMDKLLGIFEDNDRKVSERGMNALDMLLGDISDEELEETVVEDTTTEEVEEEVPTETEEKSHSMSYMEEAFAEMERKKVEELEARISLKENDLTKQHRNISQSEKLKNQITNDIKLLRSRLESMKPNQEPIGWVYFIGEEQKFEGEVDDTVKSAVKKLSKHLKLNEEAVLELLKKSYYEIKLAPKDNYEFKEVTREQISTCMNKLNELDVEGELRQEKVDEKMLVFRYTGEMDWHDLNNRLGKIGFETDSEWNKMCKSNSYYSAKLGPLDEDHKANNKPSSAKEDFTPIGREFDKETVVVFGEGGQTDVTDDGMDFGVYYDGPRGLQKRDYLKFNGNGSISVMTLEEFAKWKEENPERTNFEGFVLQDFTGQVKLGYEKKDGTFIPVNTSTWIKQQVDEYDEENETTFDDYGLTYVLVNEHPIKLENREIPQSVTRHEKLKTLTKSSSIVSKDLKSFTNQTVIILGDGDDFEIDDDETCYDIYIGDKKLGTYGSMGFGGIMTIEQFKSWKKNNDWNIEDDDYMTDLIEGIVLPNFTGTVGISFKDQDGFTDEFDPSDYIQHQFDDYGDVCITLPEGTHQVKLKNFELPLAAIRDEKIGKVLED